MSADASAARTPHRVAILQSSYIPWKGYFDIAHEVDTFVFYDDVQFTHRDWRSRNKVKTASGAEWLSVPVGGTRERLICEVELPDARWQARHWRTLQQAYGRTPHFERYRGYFEHVYLGTTWTHLAELNQSMTKHIATEFLGLRTRFEDSRHYAAQGHKLDRLVDLASKAGATHYLSGPSARSYIDPARFAQAGIELLWKDYGGYPEYPQRFAPFVHQVTVLDLLFNVGPEAQHFIWGWRW